MYAGLFSDKETALYVPYAINLTGERIAIVIEKNYEDFRHK